MGKHSKISKRGHGHHSIRLRPNYYPRTIRDRHAKRTISNVNNKHTTFPLVLSTIAASVSLTITSVVSAGADPVPAVDPTPTFPVPNTTPLPPTPQRPSQSDTGSSLPQDQTRPTVSPSPTPTIKPEDSSEPPTPDNTESEDTDIIEQRECSILGVKLNVVRACNQILSAIPEFIDSNSIGGRALRPNNPTSCHPLGLALDFPVSSNSQGDRIAAYVRAHKKELNATTILWEVDDHFDHVHVSFAPCFN